MAHWRTRMSGKNLPPHFNKQHDLHQYYMDIIYCMPNIVYWVDESCQLKGCNQQFIKLLGLTKNADIVGSPYQQMNKFLPWGAARIKGFELDDMAVMFSGEAKYDVAASPVYDAHGTPVYYSVSRVPLFDKKKRVIGLLVIWVDVSSPQKAELYAAPVVDVNPHLALSDRPLHVLMVEDNLIAQRVEKAMLLGLNCSVDVAASGAVALSFFSPGKYDLVLMDIGLEDVSGYAVTKKIRQLEHHSGHHVPIIALTSFSAESVVNDCRKYAMEGVMTKPLTSQKAKEMIEHFIYHQKMQVRGLLDISSTLSR